MLVVRTAVPLALLLQLFFPQFSVEAASLTVKLLSGKAVRQVGAVRRWDDDGNPLRAVDAKARIQAPRMTAAVRRDESTWVFESLPPGRYDLILLGPERMRIEGFHYPPLLEFDRSATHQDWARQSVQQQVAELIANSRHYENKVSPLYFTAVDDKQVRVLVQLLRDKPTSYDAQFGEQASTLRHEVWQFTYLYGGWAKEKRTKVLDRILMAHRELRQWSWLWDPRLGGIKLGSQDRTITYQLPDGRANSRLPGLRPTR